MVEVPNNDTHKPEKGQMSLFDKEPNETPDKNGPPPIPNGEEDNTDKEEKGNENTTNNPFQVNK